MLQVLLQASIRMTENAMKQTMEILILGTCALIAPGLAMTRSYLPEDGFELDYLISLPSRLTVAS